MLQAMPQRKPNKSVLKDMLNPVLLGIGANLPSPVGPPGVTIKESLKELARNNIALVSVSRLFQTPAFPPGSGADYVNAAVLCKTQIDAPAILAILNRVENKFGRTRQHRWEPRTLDIDLLAVGDQVLPDPATHVTWRGLGPEAQKARFPTELILPHPRLHERAFVLIPLADVAPDWVHPILRLNVLDMLAALPQSSSVGIQPIA